jgi:hypothetical protein
MGVKVVANTTASSTTFVRLRAAVTVSDNPVAGVSYALPAAQVAYIDLALGAILDTTGQFKFIPQVVVLTDDTSFVLSKSLAADFTPAVDVISVSALKALADGFAMNDGSEAVDGATYSFTKGIQNVTFVGDATATAALKALQDTQPVQELISKTLSRPLSDLFDLTDDETVAALKGLSDSVTMEDTLAILLLILRDFSETLTIDDLRATVFTPAVKAEQISVTDLDTISYQKNLFDSIEEEDGADILSALQHSIAKSFGNQVFANEARSLIFATSRVESVSVADAGLVSAQDYCDPTYFAEDYVGVSQSF